MTSEKRDASTASLSESAGLPRPKKRKVKSTLQNDTVASSVNTATHLPEIRKWTPINPPKPVDDPETDNNPCVPLSKKAVEGKNLKVDVMKNALKVQAENRRMREKRREMDAALPQIYKQRDDALAEVARLQNLLDQRTRTEEAKPSAEGKIVLLARGVEKLHKCTVWAQFYAKKYLNGDHAILDNVDSKEMQETLQDIYQKCPSLGLRVLSHSTAAQAKFEEWVNSTNDRTEEAGDRKIDRNGNLVDDA